MVLKQTEQQIHEALVQHIQLRRAPGMLFTHCPNGGKRHIVEAMKFKRMGVLPGVSDLLFWHEGKSFALELKAPGKRPTELQDEFLDGFRDAGGYGFWVDGLEQALDVCKSWGLIR